MPSSAFGVLAPRGDRQRAAQRQRVAVRVGVLARRGRELFRASAPALRAGGCAYPRSPRPTRLSGARSAPTRARRARSHVPDTPIPAPGAPTRRIRSQPGASDAMSPVAPGRLQQLSPHIPRHGVRVARPRRRGLHLRELAHALPGLLGVVVVGLRGHAAAHGCGPTCRGCRSSRSRSPAGRIRATARSGPGRVRAGRSP